MRWRHGSEREQVVIEVGEDARAKRVHVVRVQRVRHQADRLLASGAIGGAEADAARRWSDDAAIAGGARSSTGELVRVDCQSDPHSRDYYPMRQVDALSAMRMARGAVGRNAALLHLRHPGDDPDRHRPPSRCRPLRGGTAALEIPDKMRSREDFR